MPRAFDAVLRHKAADLLPRSGGCKPTGLAIPVNDGATADAIVETRVDDMVFAPVPKDLEGCQSALIETRAALTEMRRQRDALKAALDSIAAVTSAVRSTVPGSPTP